MGRDGAARGARGEASKGAKDPGSARSPAGPGSEDAEPPTEKRIQGPGGLGPAALALTRLQSPPAPSSSRGPGPQAPCSPQASAHRGHRVPRPYPSERSQRPPQVRGTPSPASPTLGRVARSPRSPSRSPRQSHSRRHSAAPGCISGRCAWVRAERPRLGAESVRAGAGAGWPGAGRGGAGAGGGPGIQAAPRAPPPPVPPSPPRGVRSTRAVRAPHHRVRAPSWAAPGAGTRVTQTASLCAPEVMEPGGQRGAKCGTRSFLSFLSISKI